MADPMIPLGDAIRRGSIFMRDGERELIEIDATLRQLVRRREAEIADIKRQSTDAQTDEATKVLKDWIEAWRVDKWTARVDSVRRLLKAGNISAHGRQALGKDREPIIDAAWDRAIPHGAEHNDLSFGRGPEWFDVVIVDANRDAPQLDRSTMIADHARVVAATQTHPENVNIAPRRRGRPSGSGSLAAQDQPFIEEMARLIASGEVPSVHAAALCVAANAPGAGVYESKVSRLETRWRENRGI